MVKLYEKSDGTPVEVRVGAGGREHRHLYRALPGRTANSSISDSLQSIFNHQKEMRPRTPRDVVWLVNNGKASDELAFDDYMNPDGFIVTNMIASLSQKSNQRTQYHDGRGNGDIKLQNAAGAINERWRTPAFGLVRRGTGRAEAVALGGIHGRGFWLDGANEVSYDIQNQPRDPKDSDWYVSIFVDSRFADDGTRRNLIRYPDGTGLALEGRQNLVFCLVIATAKSLSITTDLRLIRFVLKTDSSMLYLANLLSAAIAMLEMPVSKVGLTISKCSHSQLTPRSLVIMPVVR